MTFLTILGVTEILCSFKLVLEGKTGKEIPESSRLEFLPKTFVLPDVEDNTSGPLNRGGIADLPLLRTLLVYRQKSSKPSFWEVNRSPTLRFESVGLISIKRSQPNFASNIKQILVNYSLKSSENHR